MGQVCCHGNEQDRYARKDVQDRSVGYREDMHHNDSDEAKNNEKIIFKLNDDCLLRLSSHWSRGIFHMPGISLSKIRILYISWEETFTQWPSLS